MSSPQKLVLAIGGTGAQGMPVVKSLTKDGKYAVRVLTRNSSHARGSELASLPNVSFHVGDPHNESDLHEAFKGVDYAFVNLNGFAIGEKAEVFWGMRTFEIARSMGCKWFVWGNLDYGLKKGGYNEKYRCGHYDGKGRVAEWIEHQPKEPMAWSILTSGPYMEMLSEFLRPKKNEDGVYVFAAPLGDGAVPFIHLEDLGHYARWIFDHPERSIGLDLEIATAHVGYNELAESFMRVTGKQAVYTPLTEEQYLKAAGGGMWKVGHSVIDKEDPTLLTFKQNFGGWWQLWHDSGDNKGVVRRDYTLLDEILPNRVKSVEEWMRKVDYTGDRLVILKDWEDKNMGPVSAHS